MRLREKWKRFKQSMKRFRIFYVEPIAMPVSPPAPMPVPVTATRFNVAPAPIAPLEAITIKVGTTTDGNGKCESITFVGRRLAYRNLSNRRQTINDTLYDRDGIPFVHTYSIMDGQARRLSWKLRQVHSSDLKPRGKFKHFRSSAEMYFRE